METRPFNAHSAPTRHSGGGRNPESAQGKPFLSKPSLSFAHHFTYFTEIATKKTRNSYDPSEMPHRPYPSSVRPERREVVVHPAGTGWMYNHSPGVEGPPTPMAENGRK